VVVLVHFEQLAVRADEVEGSDALGKPSVRPRKQPNSPAEAHSGDANAAMHGCILKDYSPSNC
jgi:hypothetical protein